MLVHAVAALALALLTLPGTATAATGRPNVLVVMTDDQAAEGMMAVMPQTRHLIGARGAIYRDAHATTPNCCPSRASFFTGRYVHNHHVTSNTVPQRLRQTQTVQYLLRRRGYRAAIFGKYLNSWPLRRDPPFFDDWAITPGGFSHADWNWGGRVVRDLPRYTTDVIATRAVGFIRRGERHDRHPWLAWVTPLAPHWPSVPARRHRDAALPRFPRTPARSETDVSDKPDFLDAARGFPELIETVRDDGRRSLMAVDELVGRLVRELRHRGELRDTLLVFTSDNGVMLGEHGGVAGKDLPYTASTRIPLMVRWDRRVRAGTTRRDLVSNVDVATTILRAAGVRRRTDGKSLFAKQRRRQLLLEHFGTYTTDGRPVFPPWRALRAPRFLYTEYRDAAAGGLVASEYYDLRVDPWELENRAPALRAERIAELSATLDRLSRCKGRSCP